MSKEVTSTIYHGINKYSQRSCIIYKVDNINNSLQENLKEFLGYLKGEFDHIYEKIKFEKGEIVLTTHFPTLFEWSDTEFIDVIRLYLNENYDRKKEKKLQKEIKRHIKKFVGTTSALPTLNAAAELNIPVITFKLDTKRYHKIGYGKNSGLFTVTSSSKDSKMSLRIQRRKHHTNQIAEMLGIPVPKWAMADTKDELKKIWKEKFKNEEVVMKPYNRTRGRGVYVGITELDDAMDKFDLIMESYKEAGYKPHKRRVLIQKRIYGKDYRIFCLNGKFKIATLRTPAYIVGNGESTIEELIKKENKNPKRSKDKLFPVLKPIVIDDITHETLQKQGLTIDDVPSKDKQIFVKKVASVSQGGFTRDVTNEIHPTIATYCEDISRIMNAFTLGIDIMCKDISKPLIDDIGNINGGLIEVNTAPEMYLNIFPYEGKQHNDLGKEYIKELIGSTKNKTKVYTLEALNDSIVQDMLNKHTHVDIYQKGCVTRYCHSKHKVTINLNTRNTLTGHLYLNNHADALVYIKNSKPQTKKINKNVHYVTNE